MHLSPSERFVLLGTLLNRIEFVEKLIFSLDSTCDVSTIELYLSELSSLRSVLDKLHYSYLK